MRPRLLIILACCAFPARAAIIPADISNYQPFRTIASLECAPTGPGAMNARPLSVAPAIFLLVTEIIVLPVVNFFINGLLLPLRVLKSILLLPITFAEFLIHLPKNLILLPVRIVLGIISLPLLLFRVVRFILSPVLALIELIAKTGIYVIGLPVKILNVNYRRAGLFSC